MSKSTKGLDASVTRAFERDGISYKVHCRYQAVIIMRQRCIMELGLRQMDAAHIACAIHLNADHFLTTDKKILNKPISGISVLNPIDFLGRYADATK